MLLYRKNWWIEKIGLKASSILLELLASNFYLYIYDVKRLSCWRAKRPILYKAQDAATMTGKKTMYNRLSITFPQNLLFIYYTCLI